MSAHPIGAYNHSCVSEICAASCYLGDYLLSAGKTGSVVHAHRAVLQRAVHRKRAHALLDAALGDLPRPGEVPHLSTSASCHYRRLPLIPGRRHALGIMHAALALYIPLPCAAPFSCPGSVMSLTWTHAAASDRRCSPHSCRHLAS